MQSKAQKHMLELADMWVATLWTPNLLGQINHTEPPVAVVNFTLVPANVLLKHTPAHMHARAHKHTLKTHARTAHTQWLEAKQVGLMPESHLSQRPHKESARDIAFI